MAVVYACDKCGKIMKVNEKKYEIEITGIHIGEYENHHICVKCIKDVRDFFKGDRENGSLGNN